MEFGSDGDSSNSKSVTPLSASSSGSASAAGQEKKPERTPAELRAYIEQLKNAPKPLQVRPSPFPSSDKPSRGGDMRMSAALDRWLNGLVEDWETISTEGRAREASESARRDPEDDDVPSVDGDTDETSEEDDVDSCMREGIISILNDFQRGEIQAAQSEGRAARRGEVQFVDEDALAAERAGRAERETENQNMGGRAGPGPKMSEAMDPEWIFEAVKKQRELEKELASQDAVVGEIGRGIRLSGKVSEVSKELAERAVAAEQTEDLKKRDGRARPGPTMSEATDPERIFEAGKAQRELNISSEEKQDGEKENKKALF